MATHGFLDDSAFNRAFWTYSDIRFAMDVSQFNRDARNGELMVFTPERTFLVRGHPVPARTQNFKPGTQGYLLAAMPNTGPTTGEHALVNLSRRAKPREVPPVWSHQVPLRIRSMVLAPKPLEEGRYYVLAGRMGSGTGDVQIELFINDSQVAASKPFPVSK